MADRGGAGSGDVEVVFAVLRMVILCDVRRTLRFAVELPRYKNDGGSRDTGLCRGASCDPHATQSCSHSRSPSDQRYKYRRKLRDCYGSEATSDVAHHFATAFQERQGYKNEATQGSDPYTRIRGRSTDRRDGVRRRRRFDGDADSLG